ncbi:MAG: TIR domain-containing protein [Acidobacteriota bacterium]
MTRDTITSTVDIFVSYSKRDYVRVSALVAALEAHGWTVWWDRALDAGSDFRDVIDQQIRDARCMIVVWSTNANASKWVRDEADEGVRRGILVPLLIDQVLPPMGFRSIQAADLTEWRGDREDPALKQLLGDIAPVVKRERMEPQAERARVPSPGLPIVRGNVWGRIDRKWLAAGILFVLLAGWLFWRTADSNPPGQEGQGTGANAGQLSETTPAAANSLTAVAPSLPALLSAEPPPADYFVLPAVGRQPDAAIRLTKIQEKRNAITDDADWWVANGLSQPTYTVPNPFRQEVGDLPQFVPAEFQGVRVVKVIRGTPTIAVYGENFSSGRYLLGLDPATRHGTFAFDFSLYEYPKSFQRSEREFVQMATIWAQLEVNTLYVAHAHSTYAKSSDGYNAYITAIDVPSNRILWRSQPLVSNANNFVIRGDVIVAGYGFTNENDSLYVLNKADGRVIQQLPLKSGPSDLIEKGDRLHVRTYDTDYVFQFTTAAAPR